jgi:DNA-binding transcriptional MerR regulator
VIEQLIPPHFLQTGVTPDQLQSALRSNNGFYGVPALPFFLGYDPVLDSETLPERGNFFDNWAQTMKNDVYNALRRLRQAELAREQKYVSRKEAKGNRRGVRVTPYSFNLSNNNLAKADPKLEEKLEYKVFLKACLIDGTISPQEEKEIQQLRQKFKISDALHEDILKQLGYTLEDYKKALEEGVEDESDKYETFLKTAMIDKNMDTKERQALEEVRKQIGIVSEEHKYLEDEYKKKDNLIEIDKLHQLTVAELKERCKELELKLSGKKEELIERIKTKLTSTPIVITVASQNSAEEKVMTF